MTKQVIVKDLLKQSFSTTIVIAIIFLSSCHREIDKYKELETTKTIAGSNSVELSKVLEHYSKKPQDSLRLKAAIYLIANIRDLLTLDTESVTQNSIYFKFLREMWNKSNKKIEQYQILNGIDSINKLYNLSPSVPVPKYVMDAKVITSDFLIENIDKAFEVWEKAPYSNKLNFAQFCEYVLPYRCSNTYMSHSRSYFINRFKDSFGSIKDINSCEEYSDIVLKDLDASFKEEFLIFSKGKLEYLLPIKFSDLLRGGLGVCYDGATLRVNALRSIGIAASLDMIPGWGNSNAQHFWSKILTKKYDNGAISDNIQIPYNNQSNLTGIFLKDEVVKQYSGLPKKIDVYYCKTIPKVFRQTFQYQTKSLKAKIQPDENIPDFFKDDRLKDVTKEYIKCFDLSLRMPGFLKENSHVYLSCFSTEDLTCVDWGTVKSGRAIFKNVGVNVLYVPSIYSSKGIIPIDNPFILDIKGNVKYIEPSKSFLKETYSQKVPYRANVMFHANSMIGGKFQFANKSDFSDSVTVHRIDKVPFYGTIVNLKKRKKYRYLIYQFKGLDRGHVAEIRFYTKDSKGNEIQLHGKLIGNTGRFGTTLENAFDNNSLSYFVPKDDSSTYIGIDLGQDYKSEITKIKFYPRSDDNCVSEGKNYKLYYWKNRWVLLDQKKAIYDETITFNKVPSNALLLLKDAEGSENRVFVYHNSKQVFY